MSISKTILLTILLIVVFSLTQIGVQYLINWTELKNKIWFEHLYLTVLLSNLISYFTLFYFFWNPRPNLKETINFKKLNYKLIFYILVVAIGFSFALQPFWDFDKIFNYYQNSNLEPYLDTDFKFTPFFFYRTVKLLILAPVFEELFFRKFIFKELLKKNSINFSILISSLCFALIHIETPNNLIPTFFFGVISCLIYHKTKRIAYTIILHFLHNLVFSLYPFYGNKYYNWLYDLKFDYIYWGGFFFGALIVLLVLKKITTTKNV